MKKIIALDLGDAWTGIAISDALQTLARPYKTVATKDLVAELTQLFKNEKIESVVMGYPKTMKGLESDQTKKTVEQKNQLEKIFPSQTWLLQDERLSSKRADTLKKPSKNKQKIAAEKLKSHAIAAAFILDSYLIRLSVDKDK